MQYLWQSGDSDSPMHIARHTQTGEMLLKSLCNSPIPFDRSINAPWALGRTVCADCERVAHTPEEH